jgi:type I restriction enzyme S subunit
MRSNYKCLEPYIEFIDSRALDHDSILDLDAIRGISSISKDFIKTRANLVGVIADKYKVVESNIFAYNPNTARMGDKIPIALNQFDYPVLVSSIYPTFKIKNINELHPEYLMMWFRRPEFDRYARFMSHGSAREVFDIVDMNGIILPIPSIDKQLEIVKEYNIIQNRISLNQQLIQKLEETAQAIYREWFVEGIDLENLPDGWRIEKIKSICRKIGSGSTPSGGKESYLNSGISLIRSTNVFDFNFSYDDLAFIDDNQALKLKNVEVLENDILFNITGVSVARCCMVPKSILPARVNQHVMIIRPFQDMNISFYLLLNLCSTDSKNSLLGISQSGSTREAITKSDIEEFEIVVPDEKRLEKFENKMRKLFSHKDLISEENQKLTELKELLLSRLATIE